MEEQEAENTKILVTKEFIKILKDFYVDIFNTFPECKEKVSKELIIDLIEENTEKIFCSFFNHEFNY